MLVTLLRWRNAWAQLRSAPTRMLSTILAIALGVALAASVMLVSRAVVTAFGESLEALTGAADLHVVAAGGAAFDERVAETLARVPGVAAVAPVIVATAFTDDEVPELVTVVGVDMLNESAATLYETRREDGVEMGDPLVFMSRSDSVLVTPQFLERRRLARDDTFRLVTPAGVRSFAARGVIRAEGMARALGASLMVMDVYSAQSFFTAEGHVTQLDVVLEAGATVDGASAAIAGVLPPGLRVEPSAKRQEATRQLLAGYRQMLDAFSVVGLLVAALISFNRLSTVFRSRVWEIGVARTLGASRVTIVADLLKETVLLATVGIALGLALGIALAERVMPVGADIAALTTGLAAKPIDVPVTPGPLAIAGLLGLGSTVLAAILPAVRAARAPVTSVLRTRGLLEPPQPTRSRARGTRVALLAVLAVALATYRLDATGVVAICTGLVTLAATCMAIRPLLAASAGPLAHLLGRWLGPAGRLASLDLLRSPDRTVTAISTLTVGLAIAVWFGTMGHSFEISIMRTLAASRRADLIVGSLRAHGNDTYPIAEEAVEELRRLPGVAAVSGERGAMMPTHGIMAFDPVHFEDRRFASWDVGAGALPDTLARVARGAAILVSPAFLRNRRIAIGDTVTLDTPTGPWTTIVAGVNQASFYSPSGDILVSRDVLRARWNDRQIVRAHVLLSPEASPAIVREAIARTVGQRYRVGVFSAREIAESFGAVVRRGMVFTDVLLAMTLLVVILGTADTLAAGVLDRTRELGTMRAIGMCRVRVAGMLAIQALIMGLVGVLGAWGAGLVIAHLYLHVFEATTGGGWLQQITIDGGILVHTLVFGMAACLVSAIVPGYHAARLAPSVALRCAE